MKISKGLRLAFLFHIGTMVVAIAGELGLQIPIIRQVLAFLDLTFVPGIIILEAMGLNASSRIEKLLYTVGLSLAFIMFLGLIVNILFPYMGITAPISFWPWVITSTVILAILGFLAYRKGRSSNPAGDAGIEWSPYYSIQALCLYLLPVLSILGTQLVNNYQSNGVLLVVIPLVSLVPVLLLFTKFISKELYPLAVVMVSITLLYHVSLISRYLTGYDINIEYYFANLVRSSGLWDAAIPNTYNAVLSVVMLGPVYSIVGGMDLTLVFKLVYPLLYSLVPLAIYIICAKQLNNKLIAFLSAFLFMAVQTFFMEMVGLARQQIAELFLSILLLLIVSNDMNRTRRTVLSLVFTASLIVSHYAISYIFIFMSVVALIAFLIIGAWHPRRKSRTANIVESRKYGEHILSRVITMNFLILLVVASISWYIWQAGASNITNIIYIVGNIGSHMVTEFMNIFSSEALWLIATPTVTPLHEITKYLNLFTIFLTAVGVFSLLIGWKKKKFNEEYAILCVVAFVIAAAAIPIPYLAIALNTTRIYHIMLMLLAPLCATGAIYIYSWLYRKGRPAIVVPLKYVSVLFTLFLLFNTGFVYEIARDYPFSLAISQENIRRYGTDEQKASFYSNFTTEEDIYEARWLSANVQHNKDLKVYATYSAPWQVHPLQGYGMIATGNLRQLDESTLQIESGSYVYLQYLNVVDGIGTVLRPPFMRAETFDMSVLDSVLGKTYKIYTNSWNEILFMP